MKTLIFLALFLVGQVAAPTIPHYKTALVQPPVICGAQYASRPLRIVVVGNSLAWSPPQEKFNWAQSNGMAASSLQTDYAHITCEALAERHRQSVALLVVQAWAIESAVDTERDLDPAHAEAINAFAPDVVVMQWSDNVIRVTPQRFGVGYGAFLAAIHAPMVACVGPWYDFAQRLADAMRAECGKRSGHYVDIADLFTAPNMRAESFDTDINHGVGSHPNDLGHLEIARRVVGAIEGQ